MTGERIARRIARSGLCSRREAERWIGAGRVTVNGSTLTGPAHNVSRSDRIAVDGQPLPEPPDPQLFRLHKPRGVVTTRHDPQGRPTVLSCIPDGLPHLHPVGRLDLDSEGLLLFTTDASLKRHLELPSRGFSRRYRARCFGTPDPRRLATLADGTRIDGVRYGPVKVTRDRGRGENVWYRLVLHEGKNREVRRILAYTGLQVNRLIRTAYGPFRLGNLSPGAWSEVPPRQIPDLSGTGR